MNYFCPDVMFRALKVSSSVGNTIYEFHFRRSKEIQDSYYKKGALGVLE